MFKEPTDNFVAITAVIVICVLEALALFKGVDGTMFGASMAALGVVIGWVCKSKSAKKTS